MKELDDFIADQAKNLTVGKIEPVSSLKYAALSHLPIRFYIYTNQIGLELVCACVWNGEKVVDMHHVGVEDAAAIANTLNGDLRNMFKTALKSIEADSKRTLVRKW